MPVQLCKAQTTSTEFVDWLAFLEEDEWGRNHKTDFYLAQIALEVRRSYVQKPRNVKMNHMLLDFMTAGRKKERAASSRDTWLMALGIPREEWDGT